jgi:uncharacterized circularly permuted ATP-grasp superfamily protein/uncharacterized alpha-E superfamily protein
VTSAARDELLDEGGRLRGPWRRMLGTLLGLGTATLHERHAELDRAFAQEGAASLLSGAAGGQWRCDPVPFLLAESEFLTLAAGLTQRARLLEALLQDIYGPASLLAEGLLPPALVYPSPRYLRACRGVAQRQLHLYAADLLRGPDGQWAVLADRTAEPAGLAYALENRRMMARVLPELFRTMEVAQLRPFFDAWQAALHRLAAPSPHGAAAALLTPGHADPRWFEHVVLSRELGCALVEAGDLTVRDGALWVKTLRGLRPVHLLLRRQDGASLDPLEVHEGAATGIPGLLHAVRNGTVAVLNAPGAGYAESPGLAPFLPVLCARLLGEELRLPSVQTHWLGDDISRALVESELDAWVIRPALDGAAPAEPRPGPEADAALRARIAEKPWAFAALKQPVPSFAPCAGAGDTLEPRGVILRLFLLFDGAQWRPLQGGVARVMAPDEPLPGRLPQQALSKDVWVLLEEGADIAGPGHLAMPALAVRRTAGDLPSRVADNFYWFGRYLERLENAARLTRAMLARLSRAGLLPRDIPEITALAACLADAEVISEEQAAAAAPRLLSENMLRALARDDGAFAYLSDAVQSLADNLRDRLSGEMHAMLAQGVRGLRGARRALGGRRRGGASIGAGASIGLLTDFASRILEFSAAVSGYAAENMVLGGGRMFLDLGRRMERAQAICGQLAHALDQAPERIEAGLLLALELCDSVLAYRGRYLGVVQPALVLDLVLADEGNPRGLGYQLTTARSILTVLGEGQDTKLATMLDAPIAETQQIVTDLLAAPDQAAAAAELPNRLRALQTQLADLSTILRRTYFTLLPVTWTET